ncbi:uncharacterized protein At4g13230-like [Vigna radiata var. radiata]|uniref:Uncharacterized protein At4g13230-like n=1 Tax=Vigna radiata var. radiata TaxID=3916 RepID=A0A3Q0EW66_VIGRR|nr:uncharacterized protein At4g13230-like [Vigna radiata var. radiata]
MDVHLKDLTFTLKKLQTKESAKDATGTMAEKGNEGAERTKQKTEEVAASTGETLNVGEKAKQGVQGAWDMAKDTTHKINETLIGKDDDDNDGVLNDDVVELKRRVEKSYGDEDDEEDTKQGASVPFFYVV